MTASATTHDRLADIHPLNVRLPLVDLPHLDVLLACSAAPGMSLEEVERLAALQTRIDRKYVLSPAAAQELIVVFATRSAVTTVPSESGDLRSCRYRSIYFDTPDRESYRGTAHQRRRRFKVRSRTYVDSSISFLEVKRRASRGTTEKVRIPLPGQRSPAHLDAAMQRFVDDSLDRPGLGASLMPVVTTEYLRTTLVDLGSTTRATIDTSLSFGFPDDTTRRVGIDGLVVIETKSSAGVSWYDRVLWEAGVRPRSISKFGIGMAMTRPELSSNRWTRVLTGSNPQPRPEPTSPSSAPAGR